MKTATTTQNATRTPSTYWAKTKTLSRSWAFFLFSERSQWHQDKGTMKHRQSPQAGYVPHPPASTFSMLVESDILRGSRSVCP
jgi:hypothetical protein